MFTAENSATFYVSQTKGNDNANGFSPVIDKNGNGPLKTVECALEKIAQFRDSGKERPYAISLTACDSKTITFTIPARGGKFGEDASLSTTNCIRKSHPQLWKALHGRLRYSAHARVRM